MSSTFTQNRVAQILCASRWTVYRLVADGALPLAGKAGVDATELRAFIARSRVTDRKEDNAMIEGIPKLYTLEEVAQETPHTLRSLRDGARKQRFEHYRIGGKRLMDAEQIKALIDGKRLRAVPVDPDEDPAVQRELARRANNRGRGRRTGQIAA